jgi:very-short-patch-repair endonuclease
MLLYNSRLKQRARVLRKTLTDSEQRLWSRLRRKQLLGVQFHRQKPIGNYIADFYAPRASLVIELDGSQHLEAEHARRDTERTAFLESQGLLVVRFNDLEVLKELDGVLEKIHGILLAGINPP